MTRLISSQNFSNGVNINTVVKGGNWKLLFDDSRSIYSTDIINNIGDNCSLEPEVVERLELSYTSFIGSAGNTKEVVIGDVTDIISICYRIDVSKEVAENPLKVHDINLKVRYQVGDIIERDYTCNSTYILTTMRHVAVMMRAKCHWIPLSTMLYLVMDNTGGHGTDECVNEYHIILKKELSIIIIQQVPRSLYTNVLNIGV